MALPSVDPFAEARLGPVALRNEAVPGLRRLTGAIHRLDTVQSALDEGFAFVAMARALLREPELLNRWQAGVADPSTCIHCNRCMPTIYSGTRCAIDHPEPITVGRAIDHPEPITVGRPII